jgi:hypothetical protein
MVNWNVTDYTENDTGERYAVHIDLGRKPGACMDPDHGNEMVSIGVSRAWVLNHPLGQPATKKAKQSQEEPQLRLYLCMPHFNARFTEWEKPPEFIEWDCASCNNELNWQKGKPFKGKEDSINRQTLECGACWLRRWAGKPPIRKRPDDAPYLEPNREGQNGNSEVEIG